MSQNPPQPPRRPAQRPPQGQPNPQGYPPQQGQQGYPQQGEPMYQQGYSPQGQAPYPQGQPQPMMVVQPKSNPIMSILKAIAYPFVKVAQFVGGLISTIIHEMLRSAVRFIMGIILLLATIGILAVFVLGLIDANFNMAQVVPMMIERVTNFFGG